MLSTPYEQFREVVLKATSPEHKEEILELKFGCKFIENEAEYSIINKSFYITDNVPCDIKAISGNCEDVFASEYIEEKCEIIGRDLTLEDVLLAVKNKRITERITDVDSIDFGENIEITAYLFQEIASDWNLTKPAHQQSDETLLSIINLLK